MAQPYVGELRMFGGNFAPAGWMFCEGQLLPISENDTLFMLIGTTYGGDGESTFALPDLRGRLPLHIGSGYTLGDKGGVEQVVLNTTTIPQHSHQMLGVSKASGPALQDKLLGANPNASLANFGTDGPVTAAATSVTAVGGNQPHNNFQPYLCVNFIISLFGIFPSQT